MGELVEIDTWRSAQREHDEFESHLSVTEVLVSGDRRTLRRELPHPSFEMAVVPPASLFSKGVGRWSESQVGCVLPVFLIVWRAVVGAASEIRDLVRSVAVVGQSTLSFAADLRLDMIRKRSQLAALGTPILGDLLDPRWLTRGIG